MGLPDWIEAVDGKANTFLVDPDIIYPHWLDALGVRKPDRYWLEIAFGCMKLDFDVAVRQSGALKPGKRIERIVRSDGGRKERWNLTMHKPGARDLNRMSIQDRAREIRAAYRRVRGFVPA
ncbi:MAG TPA: hypothetical protein VLA52_07130 [Thermohalobaculum sp.]|nr:hypothetical protein [Thermohalobaculum sp.]